MKYTFDKDGDTITFNIIDSFTFKDNDLFFEILAKVKENKSKKVVFNMKECTFMDSAALCLLVIAADNFESDGIDRTIYASGKNMDLLYGARFDSQYNLTNPEPVEEIPEVKEEVLPILEVSDNEIIKIDNKMYKIKVKRK